MPTRPRSNMYILTMQQKPAHSVTVGHYIILPVPKGKHREEAHDRHHGSCAQSHERREIDAR